ncbi:uncharacterized protein BX664DRAFT_321512 [Halteromyces radiatus]|uniref:uncharacterized protein n=1 Tax=Halteromyces radiatus TaxID=101107 RepID=UPI00221E936D|nr:uncharacterized protein BX664DRAFT_321512 [Halteromyces radiatus]KAI8099526.1 hypothetical protein BX664DRAFT_321512 [Halteromyces radiatus]
MSTSFIPFSLLSGFFAALSSVFAKLFTDERTAILVDTFTNYYSQYDTFLKIDTQVILLAIRGICFLLIFGCNSLMWTLFTKALHDAPSSIQVTIINGAMNLATSAIMGWIIFQEPLALRWWIGASFMLAGTILISQSQKRMAEKKKD